ncbi:peptide ABC transporter substrate-binding protein [Govanella unica]|uniref:Peptide ABC transporter substrate-binding protein n=1 Tax=Govanella unica TaxID=2975056 RepID=A0A9X3TWH5_9PROT|nr:peptide ABC transporter substrate-binding protein [Govania unica]MDA5192923.1 peptide ABC transporter substrate-binding protein [Govania unica]
MKMDWRAALVALLVAVAPVMAPVNADAAGKVLRRGTASEPPSIDPHLAAGDSSSVIIDDLFVGLMTSGAKGELIYGIAQSHELKPDRMTYIFKLRPNLKWSDGAKLDASDVVYSFQRLMNPETGARYAGNLYMIDNAPDVNSGKKPVKDLGVRAIDPQTVEIKLERPTPYFLEILRSNAAVMVPRQAIEVNGKSWTRAGKMVSNGAYRLVDWVPNTVIKLDRNTNYWKAANVAIDSVQYYPTSDLGTMLKRYQADELDIIFNIPPEQFDAVKAKYGRELQVVPDYGLFYWLMNTDKPPLNDPRVRKALAISIDKEAITKRLLKDTVAPAWGVVPNGFPGYVSAVKNYDKIPLKERQKEARALLDQAGYKNKTLVFDLRFDSREEPRQIAVAMASMWSALNIKPNMRTSDFRSLTADVARKDFQMTRYQWFAPFQDPVTFVNLLRGDSRTNHSGYANKAVDDLLLRSDEEIDPAKRLKLISDAEALAMQDNAVIPLYFPVARRLIKPRVKGWNIFPGGKAQSQYLSIQ